MSLFLVYLSFINISYLIKSDFPTNHKLNILFVYFKLHLLALIFRNRGLTTSILGFRFSCDNSITLLYLFGEIFVRNQYFVGRDIKADTIMDCGSNIGLSVLYFSIIYPSTKIICFEPDPNAYSLLNKNVIQNNLQDRVSVNLTAVSDQNKKRSFYSAVTNGDLKMSLYRERSKGKRVIVDSVALPTIFNKIKGQFILKMDVEGAEFEILQSLYETKTIGRCESIVFECHHNIPNQKNVLLNSLDVLSRTGFNFVLSFDGLPHNKSTFEFQDILIWASKSKN